jgi:hypothetical protein
LLVFLLSGFGDSDEIAIRKYNALLQEQWPSGRILVAFVVVLGSFVSFLLGIVNPGVVNKAGPDWMWAGGRNDVIRNLYFKPNGSFRRYGRIALFATLFSGWIALYWLALHI